jgi:hypothetical protein
MWWPANTPLHGQLAERFTFSHFVALGLLVTATVHDSRNPLKPSATCYIAFKNNAIFPQCVFMCFVWLYEQTAMASLQAYAPQTTVPYNAGALCSRYVRHCIFTYNVDVSDWLTVLWLGRLFARLSPRRPGFKSRQAYVRFMANEWHWARFFSEYFGSPLSIL